MLQDLADSISIDTCCKAHLFTEKSSPLQSRPLLSHGAEGVSTDAASIGGDSGSGEE